MGQFTNKLGILICIFRRIIDMLEIMIIYSHALLSRKLLNHEILTYALDISSHWKLRINLKNKKLVLTIDGCLFECHKLNKFLEV